MLLKPDAVIRGHIGATITDFERCGLNIENLRAFDTVPRQVLEDHYKEHEGKVFYNELLDYMSSGPVVAIQVIRMYSIPDVDNSYLIGSSLFSFVERTWSLACEQSSVQQTPGSQPMEDFEIARCTRSHSRAQNNNHFY